MREIINLSLTTDTWVPITATQSCEAYSIKARQNDKSFYVKKGESDTATWVESPSESINGKPVPAQISLPNNGDSTGILFYLKAASYDLDVMVLIV